MTPLPIRERVYHRVRSRWQCRSARKWWLKLSRLMAKAAEFRGGPYDSSGLCPGNPFRIELNMNFVDPSRERKRKLIGPPHRGNGSPAAAECSVFRLGCVAHQCRLSSSQLLLTDGGSRELGGQSQSGMPGESARIKKTIGFAGATSNCQAMFDREPASVIDGLWPR